MTVKELKEYLNNLPENEKISISFKYNTGEGKYDVIFKTLNLDRIDRNINEITFVVSRQS